MFERIFQGLFDAENIKVISPGDFLLCLFCALLVGLLLSLVARYRNENSKSFLLTLALLPAVVCVVIMMVNGSIGAGVAVAGAFSLVRYRSVPGSAKQIVLLFLATGAGLVVGMGYLAYGLLFTLIMGLCVLLYSRCSFGADRRQAAQKVLTVTMPEHLDHTRVFSDILKEYTSDWEQVRVKTTNMGSLLRVTYHITLRDPEKEKEMIDALRCRNGNLEISLSRGEDPAAAL